MDLFFIFNVAPVWLVSVAHTVVVIGQHGSGPRGHSFHLHPKQEPPRPTGVLKNGFVEPQGTRRRTRSRASSLTHRHPGQMEKTNMPTALELPGLFYLTVWGKTM